MTKILAASVAVFTGTVAIAYSVPAIPEPVQRFEVLATVCQTSGRCDVYVAGSGDDCRAAWEHAVVPAGWTEIICVATN